MIRTIANFLIQEDGTESKFHPKVSTFMSRAVMRLFNCPAYLSSLQAVTVDDKNKASGASTLDLDGDADDIDAGGHSRAAQISRNSPVIVQFEFQRLPDEAMEPLMQLLASPSPIEVTKFVKHGQARTGVQFELDPEQLGDEDLDDHYNMMLQ